MEVIKEKKAVLHVEDDEIARDVIRLALGQHYSLEFAVDADAALSMINQKKYDSILMDINLKHGMDGIELTQEIRKIPGYENVPIVAVTAYASEFDRKEFLSHGMDYYIAKPFLLQEVVDVMDSVFHKKPINEYE